MQYSPEVNVIYSNIRTKVGEDSCDTVDLQIERDLGEYLLTFLWDDVWDLIADHIGFKTLGIVRNEIYER